MDNKLLIKVKQNLIIEHNNDDEFLLSLIEFSINYAEKHQHKTAGYYSDNEISPTTGQAIILLASHLYESRDGSTGGFFADNVQAGSQSMEIVNLLLRLDRDWSV